MDDADADPTNELQVISISNDTIYLTRGGFIKLPSSSGNGSTEDDATKGVGIGGKVHLSEFDNDFSGVYFIGYGDFSIDAKSEDGSNFYIAGNFEDESVTIGGTTINRSGEDDMYIAKFNSSGNLVWIKTASATDDSGNVYFIKSISDTVRVENTLIGEKGENDIFVVKYNSSGNLEWIKTVGCQFDFILEVGSNTIYLLIETDEPFYNNGTRYIKGKYFLKL